MAAARIPHRRNGISFIEPLVVACHSSTDDPLEPGCAWGAMARTRRQTASMFGRHIHERWFWCCVTNWN